MLRRIIAGTAVAGSLVLGVAGFAGAATPSSGTSTASPKVCGRLATIEARVQAVEAKVNARIAKAQAREANLQTEGRTQRADRIAARITKAQNREARLNARLSNVEAKCGTGSAS
jgi:hypothetical protein